MAELTVPMLGDVIRSCVGTEGIRTFDDTMLNTAWDDLGLDSLAVYEIVTRLQDELSVAIPDERVDSLRTPGQMISFVNGIG